MSFTPSSTFDYIAHFENEALRSAPRSSTPFYYEPSTNTLNFGYGMNLTGAQDDALAKAPARKNALDALLAEHGIHLTPATWASMSDKVLNSDNGPRRANELNATLSAGDWKPVAGDILAAYVDRYTIPELMRSDRVPNLSDLPDTTRAALIDMFYHNPKLLGPSTYGAAQLDDFGWIADELAFRAVGYKKAGVGPNGPGVEQRNLGNAMLALGIIPTFDGNNRIIAIDVSGADPDIIAEFLSNIRDPDNNMASGAISAQDYISLWGASVQNSFDVIVSGIQRHIIGIQNETSAVGHSIVFVAGTDGGDPPLATPIAYSVDKTISENRDRSTGSILSRTVVYESGERYETLYNTDPNAGWLSSTAIYNAEGSLIGTALVSRGGSAELSAINPVTGAILSTSLDAQGRIVNQTFEPGAPAEKASQQAASEFTGVARAVLNTLATRFISKVLTDNGVPVTIAVQAFAEATIDAAMSAAAGRPFNFSTDLALSAVNIAGGMAGTEAGVWLAQAFGLPPEAGSIVGGSVGGALTQAVLKEAFSGFSIPLDKVLSVGDLANGIASAGGGYLGGLLASALVTPTEAGQIIGSLVTAVAVYEVSLGSTAASIAISIGLQPELAPLIIFFAAFGSDFIGNLIGSLFGNTHPSVGPNAAAQNAWNGDAWVMLGAQRDNGGTTDGVIAMSSALNKIMGEAVAAIGAHVQGVPPEMSMIWFKNKYYYAFGNQFPDDSPNRFNTPAEAVEVAAVRWMNTLTLVGGEPYMMYVARHSTAATLADFYADLDVGHVFGVYADDPVAFNIAIVAQQDPALFANWLNIRARAQALGLDQLSAAELRGLELFGTITPDSLAQGLPLLGFTTDFLGTDSHDYFVDHPANGLEVYKFDDRAGVLVDALVLHKPDDTKFSLPSGAKVLGAARHPNGDGGYVLITRDSAGHVVLYGVDTHARISAGVNLTYADGGAFVVGQTMPAYNSDAYWQMWQATLHQIGYIGPFDGVTPKTWFQATFGEALDGNSAAGLQQLLDHVHSVKAAPVNAQFVGTANGLLRNGGFNIISEDASGHLVIHEFNARWQAVAARTLTYSGPSPFTFTQQPIPEFNSDAYWALWQGTLRAIGYAGPFDGHSPMAWYNATFGVGIDNHSSAGLRQLLDKLAANNPQVVGAFSNIAASVGYHFAIEDNSGRIGLHSFDAQGRNVAQNWLTDADGGALAWASGSTIVGGAVRLPGRTAADVFIRHPDGSLHALELDASSRVVASQALTSADGKPFLVALGGTVTDLGAGLLRKGGQDVFIVAADGRLSVNEFDASGRLVAAAPLYMEDGSGFYLSSNFTLLATAENLFNRLGHNLLLLDSAGQVSALEFDRWGKAHFGGPLYVADGGQYVLPTGASLQQAGTNFFDRHGVDLIQIESDGHVSMLEFDQWGKAYVGSPIYLPEGEHFYLAEGATFLGAARDVFGLNGQNLLFLRADGTVQVLEFAETDRPRAVASIVLTNPDGSPFILGGALHAIGTEQDALGGHGLVVQTGDGQLRVYDFNGHGRLLAAVSRPLAVGQGFAPFAAPATNDPPTGAVTVAGTTTEGELLIASNTLADTDGLGPLGYRWQRDSSSGFVDIAGATGPTYRLADLDAGARIRAIARYTDSHGAVESVASAPTGIIANVNDAPIGTVMLNGFPIWGQTLSAISTFTDSDGIGTLHYQWQNGTTNVGVDAPTYWVDGPGQNIRVIVSYTDGHGTAESVASPWFAGAVIPHVNHPPGGIVWINGAATEDQTLTAFVSVTDADMIGMLHYHWTRGGTNVGADQSTYTLGDGDVGQAIRVTVSYVDGYGAAESLASAPTGTVANINDAPVVSGAIMLGAIGVNSGARLITQVELLSNAHDIDSLALKATDLQIATGHGTLVDNLDGTWSYTPKINDDTQVAFSYRVFDGAAAVADNARLDILPAQSSPQIGGPGEDSFTAATGNSRYSGGFGIDMIAFDFSLAYATVSHLADTVVVDGPMSHTVLSGFERYAFADGIVSNNDGNPLVDDLYYYTQNPDVWNAGVDADVHFALSGWREGRDPNEFFDSSFYLTLNQDVRAAGMNPLDHYHLAGWRDGRDPGLHFDTTLYLMHNPDVAAAGIDPLWHFLAAGITEGRQAFEAIGTVSNGFDAQYYLLQNPDVAGAGVDPLFHFNMTGWHEGRNPNAYFDTAGYLSHNPDVRAAGVNPLDHFQRSGWREGRDPSSEFDVRGYLAANPDVAAANINPLDHFLNAGIYEGRTAVNDGLWH